MGKGYYTVQKCSKCEKNVKIEALGFLLNLDKKVLCENCKKKGEKMKVMAVKDYNKMQEAKFKKAVAGWDHRKGGFPYYPMYFFYDENQEKRITGFVAINEKGNSQCYGETEKEAINRLKKYD